MENEDQFEAADKNYFLTITDEIKADLLETVKWTRFIAIASIVVIGLVLLFFLASLIVFATAFLSSGMAVFPIFLNILLIGISLIPIFYLYKFSVKLKKALITEDEQLLASGFNFLKSHYRFYGILLMILLIIYGIVIMFLLLFGGLGAFMR